MIWQDESFDSPSQRGRLADTLLDQIPALCGNPALAKSTALTEAAAGVAAFLDEQETFPNEVHPHAACNLVSRALEAAGDTALARRLHIAGAALVYPGSWVVAGDDTVWVLDAGRLLDPHDPGMELALFERLRSILTSFADVWDATRGRGVLGLKGLVSASRHVLGPSAQLAGIARLSREIHSFSGLQLVQLKTRRQWVSTPALMSLY